MDLTLYVLAGSHPCETARLMLHRKALAHRERELPPVLSRLLLPRLGFAGKTVPAIAAGATRVQGTRAISRWLDQVRPEPPLFPADPEARERVARAEAFGEELQDVARRLSLWGLARDEDALEQRAALSTLPGPRRAKLAVARRAIHRLERLRGATDEAIRVDLEALPMMFDRLDGWAEEGVIAGQEPNAADFQLAPTVAVLLGMADLEPVIARRPAARIAGLAANSGRFLSAGVLPRAA